MKKYCLQIFLSIILLLPLSIYAADGSILTGKVVDEANGLPIPFASVAIYNSTADQPFFTTITDDDGLFRINALKPGSYKLRIGYVGYVSLNVSDIVVDGKVPEKKLGTFKLVSDQNTLGEVTIVASKPLVEFGADGVTYNVNQSVLAEGSTATDILKNVPMVQVDVDGNATIAGKRNTRIFIDGKPSDYMTSNITDLLNVLPSDAIEKIEVLTNPPAKYSGDGEGIINVVLKKGYKVGFNGNIGITAGIRGNYNTNGNASYRDKNWSVNGSAAYRENIGKNNNTNYRTNIFTDTTFYYNQFSNSRNLGSGTNLRAGFDWDITPSQNLRISANFNRNLTDNTSGTDLHYLNEELIETRLRNQLNTTDGKSRNFSFNADYKLNIDTSGGKLTMGITINSNNNDDDRLFNRSFTYPVFVSPSLQNNLNNVANDGINFNLDYDKPVFRKRDLLEFGLQYNLRNNDNDLLVRNFDFNSGQYQTNNGLTNQFVYKENIWSGYGSYTLKKNGWSVKTGLRTEITDVNFDLSTGSTYDIKPYISLFPNLSINRFFRKRYNLGASFSIRVSRPRENTLNPQINNSDPQNISYGNPDLVPAYTRQMDISFGAFGNKWSFTPRLSYSTSNGVIERYRTVSPNGVSESTFENVGRNRSLALILIGNYRPTKTISTNANFSLIQSDYTSKLNSALNRNGLSVRSSAGFSMQLPAKIAFESNVNYNNNINAQGRTKGSVTTSFAARKLFLNNKLNFRVSTNNPFGNPNNTLYNEGTNFILQSYSTSNTSNVNFSLNYRFTSVKTKKTIVPPPSNKQ